MAAMTSYHTEKCCYLLNAQFAYAASARRLLHPPAVYSSWSIVHSYLLCYHTWWWTNMCKKEETATTYLAVSLCESAGQQRVKYDDRLVQIPDEDALQLRVGTRGRILTSSTTATTTRPSWTHKHCNTWRHCSQCKQCGGIQGGPGGPIDQKLGLLCMREAVCLGYRGELSIKSLTYGPSFVW